ncbi:hypothetical protein [Algibacter sp. 2305UL17-15]|uniref:hypothetical protein n=1 Tax=Algibacter sp. 2305UL17-15 TaxID=3231268 RepID=UPI00345862A8
MKNLMLAILFIICMDCNEDDSCNWELIESAPVNNTVNQNLLNEVFSNENDYFKDFGDTLLIISDEQELFNISNIETDMGIDFEKYTLVGGKFRTSSISNEISTIALYKCNPRSEYRLEVIVKQCTECFAAIGNLYYWKIYPSSIDSKSNILLTIK